jgi:AraC family transcriptional regulator
MERRRSGPGADRLTSSTSSLVENIVQPELDWRSPPPTLTLISGQPLRIAISRWRLQSQGRVEVASDTDDDCHVLSIALRRTRKELFIGGKSVWLGGVRDEMLLTGPKRGAWRATVEGGCDFLRVFLPQTLIAECYTEAFGGGPSDAISMFGVLPVTDSRLYQLGQTFKALNGYDPVAGPCFADSLGLALGLRLVELAYGGAEEGSGNCKLARPKIARVVSYIEDNIAKALCLSELSEMAGLSRVQFVRQFKEATGQPPHAYILQRRIERAKELLKNSDSTIIGVALDLGFYNQSHFTKVFSKFVGMTPGRWRNSQS